MVSPPETVKTTLEPLVKILNEIKAKWIEELKNEWKPSRLPSLHRLNRKALAQQKEEYESQRDHLAKWVSNARSTIVECLYKISYVQVESHFSIYQENTTPYYEYERIRTELTSILDTEYESPLELPSFQLPKDFHASNGVKFSEFLVLGLLIGLSCRLNHWNGPGNHAERYVVFNKTSGFGALQDQILRAVDSTWSSMSAEEQSRVLRELEELRSDQSIRSVRDFKSKLHDKAEEARKATDSGVAKELIESSPLGRLLCRAGFAETTSATGHQHSTQLSIRKQNPYFPTSR